MAVAGAVPRLANSREGPFVVAFSGQRLCGKRAGDTEAAPRCCTPMQMLRALCLTAGGLLSGACFDGHVVETFDRSFDLDGAVTVEHQSYRGDLTVDGVSDGDRVEVHAELRSIRAGSMWDDDAEDSVVIEVEQDDDVSTVIVDLDRPPGGYWLDVHLTVPDHVEMFIEDSSGDITVANILALDIDDASGDLAVSSIAGDLRIDDGTGDIFVSDVGGNVDVDDGSGDLDVRDVNGDVDINDGSGDIDVRYVDGTVTVHDGSGDISVRDAGDVVIEEDGSGDVDID